MVAALVLLTAFALSQLRVLHTKSLAYLLSNMLGSEVLAMAAWAGHQWGVLVLEGTWSLISAAGFAHAISAILDRPARARMAVLRIAVLSEPAVTKRRESKR